LLGKLLDPGETAIEVAEELHSSLVGTPWELVRAHIDHDEDHQSNRE
jgi:hypothetical protein